MPHEVRELLASRVVDPPPIKKHDLVGDAIRELDQGSTNEGQTLKFVRASLWCLLHFPGEFVPTHMFLGWASGNRHIKGSDAVKRFSKGRHKHHKAIERLGLRVVGYTTQRETIDDPTTVDGFRLTTDGDDYYREVIAKNDRKLSRMLSRAASDVTNERVLVEDIQNSGYKAQTKRDKDIHQDLQKRGVVGHFGRVPHLLTAGTKKKAS